MSWWAVGASVVGAVVSSNSARSAGNKQADASAAALATQKDQFAQTREDFTPYRETGYRALSQLEAEGNKLPTAAEVMSDPGYQFGLQQGQLGLDRKASAMGGRVSGEALKRAAMFSADYASSGYSAAYQRRNDRLNRLSALAGIGQTATGTGAGLNQNSTNAISSLITNQGDAAAAGKIAQGNIWQGALNQAGAAYGRRSPAGSASTGSNYDWTGSPEYF
jgi:hypothetical protein